MSNYNFTSADDVSAFVKAVNDAAAFAVHNADGSWSITVSDTAKASADATFANMTSARAAHLKDYASIVRLSKEIGGHVVGGVVYPSDRDTQAKLTAAALFSQVDSTQTFTWKLADGTFTPALPAAQMIAVAAGVGGWVNRCFALEASILTQITSGAITTTAQIDSAFAALT